MPAPRHLALLLFLAGLALVVGSCVPVVGSLYRFATLDPVMSWAVPTESGRLQVAYRAAAGDRLALGLHWRDNGTPAVAGPAVTYTLDVMDTRGGRLQSLREVWTGASPLRDAPNSTPGGTARWLQPFEVTQDGPLHFDLVVEPAEVAAAGRSLELQLFSGVPQFKVSFFSALVLWILGILTVLIGAIWWLRHLAAGAGAPMEEATGDDARMWAMFCHLSALLGYLLPFGQLIGPAVVWMAKRERSCFVDAHGREALNFQISVMLYTVVALIACFVLIGFLLLFALVLFHVAMTLYASLRAQQGDAVRYPMALRVLPSRQVTSG